ncbi:unnamed protein product [Brugia timori]|uniref:Uncharacterized protein n=1 Tax=Brugia timori TaxID=42155 RepID=A0A0R3QG08_9BILA|nr:unnamed protein product [Brugia timori]
MQNENVSSRLELLIEFMSSHHRAPHKSGVCTRFTFKSIACNAVLPS